jgi:hypothetical protein
MILRDAHDFMHFSPKARSLREHGENEYVKRDARKKRDALKLLSFFCLFVVVGIRKIMPRSWEARRLEGEEARKLIANSSKRKGESWKRGCGFFVLGTGEKGGNANWASLCKFLFGYWQRADTNPILVKDYDSPGIQVFT